MAEANGAEDHVHIATALPPTRSISDVLREIKAGSSAWAHREFADMREFAWQEGYAAFSVSRSAMPKVIDYIRRQKEHHAKMTFVDELTLLLKRHGVEFDPRYL
jgi:REP element-mobilizing transposase RayT